MAKSNLDDSTADAVVAVVIVSVVVLSCGVAVGSSRLSDNKVHHG